MTTPASPLPWDLEFETTFEPAHTTPPRVSVSYDYGREALLVTLENRGDSPIQPGDVRLTATFPRSLPADGAWAWLHGRYMQMDALVRNFGAPVADGYDGRYARQIPEGQRYISREVIALSVPSQPSPVLLAGSLRQDRFFVDLQVDVDETEEHVRALHVVFDLEATTLAPGEFIELPPLMLVEGRDAQTLIEHYADAVAAEMQARVPDHVSTGWCSWYYFYNRVSEADVVANLDEMVREKHPAEYVQVDDGYQSHTGDWLTPNEKFPSGMKALADRIRAAGYRPGIWLAPFVMHEDSVILRDHPEMALRTSAGEIFFVQTWLGRCAVLDCTHPASEAWLRDTFSTVVRNWGYEILKLDALAYAARDSRTFAYHQPGTTGPANLRRGLEIIREAVLEDTFILGCTCNFGPAIGLVDAMRVGPDVKETWADDNNPSVRHAMRLTLQRNWMHNRWWANDPDCLIVRDTDTELTEAEVRFLATGIALSGGMVVASDDLPKLPPARRQLAYALFPPPGVAARPEDPSAGPVPSAWRVDLEDGRALVGILNWGEESRWIVVHEHLKPGEVAFDAWNGRVLGKGDILLRPHEGTLWQVAGRGATPRVVGDTGSLTYAGLARRQVSGQVHVANESPRTRTIAVESRGQVFEVDLAPGEKRIFQ